MDIPYLNLPKNSGRLPAGIFQATSMIAEKTLSVDIVGNGFELWRRLYRDYEGTSEIMNLNGTAKLMAFPQCTDYRKLNNHLDDFVYMLNRFGTGMPDAQIKALLWNTLPGRMRTTIVEH